MTFHPQFVSVQYVWHNVPMEKMILPSLAKDQCIIQIDHHNFAQICFENIIDYPLESGKSVSKTKWHEHPFIKPKFGFESCLPCVCCIHANLMIACCKIHFGKEAGTLQMIQ